MTESSVASQQLKQLRNKLERSTQARDQLERTYEAQFDALTGFLSRLANVAKGIDLELDNKLAKLRKLLEAKPDLEKVQPQLDEINKLLNHHSSRMQKEMQAAQQVLQTSGKQLQKIKGLPDQLRRDLRGVLKGIESTPDSMVHFIPVIDRLATLYQQALAEKTGSQPEPSSGAVNGLSEMTEQLHQDIVDELQNLLGELAFSGSSATEINQIRRQLIEGINHNQLLECCLVVIKVIVQSVSDERSSSETFLGSLNDALSQVHKAVSTSIESSKSSAEKKQDLNNTLRSSVTQMSTAVDQATDFNGLKSEINHQLSNIVAALEKKEELELDEQLRLLKLLETMQNKLSEMEKQANEYRSRLSEQKFKSLQDPLTKLPNRAALDERFDVEFERWKRYKKPLCVAVLDIDFFKRVNDTYGHAAGDKTLQVVASAVKASIRQTDFVARYGGEEFVMLMPETSVASAKSPLETLRTKISKIPFKFKNDNVNITISIGVSEFKKGDNRQTVFDRADACLYKAKETGRNKLVIDK